MLPTSPAPFMPFGLVVQGMSSTKFMSMNRYIIGARHAVVHIGAGKELPAFGVVNAALMHRLADPLDDPAGDLPACEKWIDDGSNIVEGDELYDIEGAGIAVDFNLADITAVGKCRKSCRKFAVPGQTGFPPSAAYLGSIAVSATCARPTRRSVPTTLNVPSANSMSAADASNTSAAIRLPFSIRASAARSQAMPPTGNELEPPVPLPVATKTVSP